jgi:mannosyltransferase
MSAESHELSSSGSPTGAESSPGGSSGSGSGGGAAEDSARDFLGPLLLLGAVLVGLLRFWRLGDWSFWVDEVYTYADAHFGLSSDQLWNPIGYRLILETAQLLSERPDEFSMRFLPAVAGWLCIPLSFWAFRVWVGDRRAALVALLLAASSWHIFWSQNARFYTFAMVTTLLGGGFVLRGLLRGKSVTAIVGLGIVAAGTAFHVTASLMVPALCIAAGFARYWGKASENGEHLLPARGASKLLAGALVLGGLIATPWLWTALEHHSVQKGISNWLQGPLHLAKTLGYFYTPVAGAAAIVGAVWAVRRRDPAGLFVSMVTAVVIGGSLVIATQAQMTAQYTFCVLPWFLLIGVLPLEALGRCKTGRALFHTGALVLFLPALAGSLLYFTARGGERARWRDAYTYVDSQRAEGDLILGMASAVGEFYLGANTVDPRRPVVVSGLGAWFPDGPRRWNRHDRKIWIVIRPQWYDGLNPPDALMLETWLANDCRMVKSFPQLMEGRDLEVRVYVHDSAAL